MSDLRKVKDLIIELQKQNPEAMVVIDRDKCGWHAIKDVTLEDGEDDDKIVSVNISK